MKVRLQNGEVCFLRDSGERTVSEDSITAQYEGAESWSSTSDQHENTVEVSCTMREEPIESHPNFESWAGTPQKPNCGIFDEDGKFVGWNSKTQGGKIMAGVKSYLVPSYSAAVGYISRGMPSLGGIGSIGGGGSTSRISTWPCGRCPCLQYNDYHRLEKLIRRISYRHLCYPMP